MTDFRNVAARGGSGQGERGPHVRRHAGRGGQLRRRPGGRGGVHRHRPAGAHTGPGQPRLPRTGRALSGRAGIRQFIDLGSGIPTQGNVHEVAQAVEPGRPGGLRGQRPGGRGPQRVAARRQPDADIVDADIRRPADVLASPQVRKLIDFDQPVAVLMIAILHFVTPEENPAGHRRRVPGRPARRQLAGPDPRHQRGPSGHRRRGGPAVPLPGDLTGHRPLPRRDPRTSSPASTSTNRAWSTYPCGARTRTTSRRTRRSTGCTRGSAAGAGDATATRLPQRRVQRSALSVSTVLPASPIVV